MIGQKGIPATYGGIERHVEELAGRMVPQGVELDVYCRPHYTPADASFPGVRLIRLPSLNTKHLDAITHTVVSTAHAVASRADIIHYHALGPSALAWVPRLTGQRVVATVHGLDWRREKWGWGASTFLHMCEWSAKTLPHAVIVVSKTLRDYFEEQGAKNIHYIPNGTALPPEASPEPLAELGLEPGKFILFVGRLVPEKGLHLLVRAHRESVSDWPLVIAGGGHFTDDYVDACKKDSAPSAHFLGPVYGDRLAALQQHAAVVVSPSSLEGLSIALLEAMSFGRAVLGSDIPENLEVLDGIGERFESGNAKDLAVKLRRVLDNPGWREESGAKGRERIATEYNWDRVTDQTLKVYRG